MNTIMDYYQGDVHSVKLFDRRADAQRAAAGLRSEGHTLAQATRYWLTSDPIRRDECWVVRLAQRPTLSLLTRGHFAAWVRRSM
jgi:hypothetical protein